VIGTGAGSSSRLARAFFARSARAVAVDLLGKRLVRLDGGRRVGGIIAETEAYCDGDAPDLACHGSRNGGRPTARTAVMFGPPGHAYVYFTYGMHWLFNIVTGEAGRANAVLIRALEPIEGQDLIAARRRDRAGQPLPRGQWTSGPAKLAEALAIDGTQDGVDLCDPAGPIWLEDALPADPSQLRAGPRIGLGATPEPWRSMPWRYWLAGNAFVSRPR
jgi:DNA-3-methyladenine glycosylase